MKDSLGGKKGKKKAAKNPQPQKDDKLVLQKPTAISGKKHAWFDRYYLSGSQLENDRKLFSR